jgi:hypothetical protein
LWQSPAIAPHQRIHGPARGAMTQPSPGHHLEIPMANVVLHPATRAQMGARLAEINRQLELAREGCLHLLAQVGYRATTMANAKREGVSLQEMHNRGLANLICQLEVEGKEIRAGMRDASS